MQRYGAMAAAGRLLPPESKPVVIRQVWAHNLDYEFALIRSLIPLFPCVSMDTEFPGVVFLPGGGGGGGKSVPQKPGPCDEYRLLKKNVDALKLIQVGLTFSDAAGNLPDFGTSTGFIWEFNFRDFDATRDLHAPDSVALLRRQGVDLDRNREEGVDSCRFAGLMLTSGLLFNPFMAWITFQGAYDFGYLVKILTRRNLPGHLEDFLGLIRAFFGGRVYDVKNLIQFSNNLYGGLDRVAKTLQVNRRVGECHQAGSDSLLTWLTFKKMKDLSLVKAQPERVAGVLYGLDIHSV